MRRTTELAIGRAYSQPMDREFKMFLRLGVCALRKLPGSLLKSGKGNSAPLRQQTQVRIATERSVMTEFAQEIAYAGMVLQIPGRQVRWQPLDLKGPGGWTCCERLLQQRSKRGGIALCPHPQPVVEIALRPEVLRRDEDAPAGPKRPR